MVLQRCKSAPIRGPPTQAGPNPILGVVLGQRRQSLTAMASGRNFLPARDRAEVHASLYLYTRPSRFAGGGFLLVRPSWHAAQSANRTLRSRSAAIRMRCIASSRASFDKLERSCVLIESENSWSRTLSRK